jgi:hypothetical protein
MTRALALVSLLAACGGTNAKTDVTDDFSQIADEKSDAFSKKMTIVGTLTDPNGNVSISYTKTPIYRAIKLHALVGDWVKITVTAGGKVPVGADAPDSVTFLLDSKFKIVAKNDDANSTTRDSQIVTQLKKSGTFYVVVRDYNYASVTFNAELAMARVSGDPLADANSWFQLFFTGNDYNDLAAPYSVTIDQMPQAAQDDVAFFQKDVGGANGFALPYGDSVLYMLQYDGGDDAYDARPYDADGNPIAAIAEGGDSGDISFK